MKAFEINFDGLVGPTHNYSGLSWGNVASIQSKNLVSNPKEAALQGLAKMKFLADMGIKQAVLPPQERPHLPTLRALGFYGSTEEVLTKAMHEIPEIYLACCSAASMWTANSVTVAPSSDTENQHVHITPANLSSKFHRSIEKVTTYNIFKQIFHDPIYFTVHPPLPSGEYFSDEGAANQTRFCKNYEHIGVHLFVYGRSSFRESAFVPKKFPARQVLEASQAIARMHRLDTNKVIYLQQNPEAIDAGAFHNDVVSVSNRNVFLYHEKSFVGGETVIDEIKKRVSETCEVDLYPLKVAEKEVSLQEAVSTYLFNSQIVSLEDGGMALIAPIECQESLTVQELLNQIVDSPGNPIGRIHYVDLRQSMLNGGGPACLRVRIVLNELELSAMKQSVLFTDSLYEKLKEWVSKYYRDRLTLKDLADPSLYQESKEALQVLTKILNLGPIYSFQK